MGLETWADASIKNIAPNVGDWVILTTEHKSCAGTFEKGTKVKVTGVTPMRGFDIEDEFGNKMDECGYTL